MRLVKGILGLLVVGMMLVAAVPLDAQAFTDVNIGIGHVVGKGAEVESFVNLDGPFTIYIEQVYESGGTVQVIPATTDFSYFIKQTTSQAGSAFSWRFDLNYEPAGVVDGRVARHYTDAGYEPPGSSYEVKEFYTAWYPNHVGVWDVGAAVRASRTIEKRDTTFLTVRMRFDDFPGVGDIRDMYKIRDIMLSDGTLARIGFLVDMWDVGIMYYMQCNPASALTDIENYINNLPDNVFRNNPTQRKNALSNKLEEVRGLFQEGETEEARMKLLKDVVSKMDGSITGRTQNDWITDPVYQETLTNWIYWFVYTQQTPDFDRMIRSYLANNS